MEKTTQSPVTLREAVANQISGAVPQITDSVVEILAGEEIKRRTSMVVKALRDLDALEHEIKRVKPDQQSFDSDGKVVSELFSKSAVEELKKKREQVEKITKSIEKALNENDFSLLTSIEKA